MKIKKNQIWYNKKLNEIVVINNITCDCCLYIIVALEYINTDGFERHIPIVECIPPRFFRQVFEYIGKL